MPSSMPPKPRLMDGLALRSLFFIKAAISAPLLNGPEYGPLSDSARLASRARRCWGVYSPSAVGNWERSITTWGVMTILLPIARTSTRSPLASPTAVRTVLGMVIWPLCWTLTSVPIRIQLPEIRNFRPPVIQHSRARTGVRTARTDREAQPSWGGSTYGEAVAQRQRARRGWLRAPGS